jgi:hypothetical protein
MLAIGDIQDYFSRAGIREGAVESFLLVAGVIALAAGAALLALWGLVALVKFFWEHSGIHDTNLPTLAEGCINPRS